MTINYFHEAIPFIKKRSLMLCDIDYTLVNYGKSFAEFLNEVSNEEVAAYRAYDDYIHSHPPRPTDHSGFIHLMKEILQQKGKLIFVTARPPEFEAFTRNEFKLLNLDYDFFEVYYLGGKSKGEFCQKYIRKHNYDHIILIDDYKKNIQSFHAFVPGAMTILFRLKG